LYFSELDPIKDTLKRRNEMGGFKAMFLGAPLVWKVKKHARVILEELRALQVRRWFSIDSFSQLVACRPR
jgi:hypothetical protein